MNKVLPERLCGSESHPGRGGRGRCWAQFLTFGRPRQPRTAGPQDGWHSPSAWRPWAVVPLPLSRPDVTWAELPLFSEPRSS